MLLVSASGISTQCDLYIALYYMNKYNECFWYRRTGPYRVQYWYFRIFLEHDILPRIICETTTNCCADMKNVGTPDHRVLQGMSKTFHHRKYPSASTPILHREFNRGETRVQNLHIHIKVTIIYNLVETQLLIWDRNM